MNMQENARLVLGLRAAGWSEKKSMISSSTSRREKISTNQNRTKRLNNQSGVQRAADKPPKLPENEV